MPNQNRLVLMIFIFLTFEIGQTITLEVRRGEALREVVVAIMDIS